MKEMDLELLRRAFTVAGRAASKGNPPFGAVLVNEKGEVILEGEHIRRSAGDPLAHAVVNLIREAGKKYHADFLRQCTLYTSAEPCPMCAAAIFWSGVSRLVFGLSRQGLFEYVEREGEGDRLDMSARLVLESGSRRVLVTGPLLEKEAAAVVTAPG